MKLYKVTYTERRIVGISATSEDEAREKFLQGQWDDEDSVQDGSYVVTEPDWIEVVGDDGDEENPCDDGHVGPLDDVNGSDVCRACGSELGC